MIKYIGKSLLIEEDGQKVLVVGDLHLGYEELLNRSGVFITRKMFEEMLSDFKEIFEKIELINDNTKVNVKESDNESLEGKFRADNYASKGKNIDGRHKIVDKIVLLGDVKHNFSGIMNQEWTDILELFDFFHKYSNEIIVTRGNHDNYLKNITGKRKFVSVEDYYISGEYCFMHGDKDFGKESEIYDKKIKCWVVGHVHPAIKLSDGVKTEKYKCFLTGNFKGKKVIIVPSFSEYSEGSDLRENDLNSAWRFDIEKFKVGIVGEDLRVLDFGKLGKIK